MSQNELEEYLRMAKGEKGPKAEKKEEEKEKQEYDPLEYF